MPRYRSHTVSPIEALWSPPLASLWAWFRTNEGSGTTIIDYSPYAVNGSLVNYANAAPTTAQKNYFWNTTSGFGSQTTTYNSSAKILRISAARNTNYCSIIGFIYFPTYGSVPSGSSNRIQLGGTGGINLVMVGVRTGFGVPYYWCLTIMAGNYYSATYVPALSTWYAFYAYAHVNTVNGAALYIRGSGDSDWTLAVGPLNVGAGAGSQTLIQSQATNEAQDLKIGDLLFYADSASTGIPTLTQATDIYNNLKARYGMT